MSSNLIAIYMYLKLAVANNLKNKDWYQLHYLGWNCRIVDLNYSYTIFICMTETEVHIIGRTSASPIYGCLLWRGANADSRKDYFLRKTVLIIIRNHTIWIERYDLNLNLYIKENYSNDNSQIIIREKSFPTFGWCCIKKMWVTILLRIE